MDNIRLNLFKSSDLILILSVMVFFFTNVHALENCEYYDSFIIESINITGLKKTSDIVIKRELKHKVGEKFSCKNWQEEKLAFQGLDLFSEVDLLIKYDVLDSLASDSLNNTENNGKKTIKLTYDFSEMFSWMIFPAGKTSDQDGIMLGLSLFTLNFLGQDIRLEAQARTSINPLFEANEYMLQASSPWIGYLPIEYEAVVVRTNSWNSLKEFNEDSWWEKLEFNYRITSHFALLLAFEGLMVKHDKDYIVKAPDEDWLSQDEWDVSSYAAGGLVFNNLDGRINPHNGIRQELRLAYGGVDSRYWEFLSDFRAYFTLADKNIFHFSLLGQYRPGLDAFYMMYNVGGANSLRGYNPDKDVKAPHEILGSIEYRYEFFDRKQVSLWGLKAVWGLQAVVGADGAYIWDDRDNLELSEFLSGAFIGVHVLIPGLDRLRFEYGFSKKELKGTFSFAMFEKSTTQRWRSR